ncbi:MAG: phosphate ABC transporter permease PstA [Metamycoplasmataceae bacterium]
MNNNILFKRKNSNNNIFKGFSAFFSAMVGIIFFGLIGFITYEAIKGFTNFGIVNMLFTNQFNPAEEQFSFWIPFSITLLSSFIALLIAVPLGIRVAIFIKYRISDKWEKKIVLVFQTLSGIPSVIFGLFAINSLGWLLNELFGISKNSVFNSSIMLCFMVLPSIVSLTLESLNSIDPNLLTNSLAMGNSKSRSIYKICKKAARSGIVIAVIVSLSRAMGESMAMSIILQSAPDSSILNSDFFSILNSSTQSLGAYISTTMFADANPEVIRPLLYAFGLIMLFFSMILNIIIIPFSMKKNNKFQKITNKIINKIMYIPDRIKILLERLFFKSKFKLEQGNYHSVVNYTKDRKENYKYKHAYSSWKIFWEYFAIIISAAFLIWITTDILINGIIAITNDPNTFFDTGKNSIAQSFLNTILIILVTLIIGFPIALLTAIYLNEYAKNKKIKATIMFFIDSIGSTPSIIFGMFGLLFFIQTLGLTNTGVLGNSLLAGALTLVIVVIPSFTRLLEQNLKNIPMEIRMNSYALGNSKFETIKKLVLPPALYAITSSIVSTIGRILSETAPLYLTAGLSSSSVTALNRPGTSLTTHIYAQIFSTSSNATTIQYQCAFITMILVFSLVIIGYVIIPNRKLIGEKFYFYKEHLQIYLKRKQN